MRIGIDIDGTLTNLVDRVIAYGQEYELENNLPFGLSNPNTDYFSLAFEWGNVIGKKFWRDSFNKINSTAPRALAKKYLDLLHEKGHEIYVVTARSYEEFSDPYAYSKKWLKKYKIPFDKLIVNASNKGAVCEENHIEAFLDDNPINCDSTSAAGVKTFMMHNFLAENYNNPAVKKVYSFVEFYREIIKLSEAESQYKTYVINVSKKPFKKIKTGQKTVDLRLNDIRRNNIKAGDTIVFRSNNNPNKQVVATVLNSKKFFSFKDLISYYGKDKCGFEKKSIDQANNIMKKFYTESELKELGVIGFEFQLKK